MLCKPHLHRQVIVSCSNLLIKPNSHLFPNINFLVSIDLKWLFIFILQKHCVKSVQIRSFFWSVFFPHSDWIRRDTPYLSVFSPNAGKYGPDKTPYLHTFHTVKVLSISSNINPTFVPCSRGYISGFSKILNFVLFLIWFLCSGNISTNFIAVNAIFALLWSLL